MHVILAVNKRLPQYLILLHSPIKHLKELLYPLLSPHLSYQLTLLLLFHMNRFRLSSASFLHHRSQLFRPFKHEVVETGSAYKVVRFLEGDERLELEGGVRGWWRDYFFAKATFFLNDTLEEFDPFLIAELLSHQMLDKILQIKVELLIRNMKRFMQVFKLGCDLVFQSLKEIKHALFRGTLNVSNVIFHVLSELNIVLITGF